MQKNFAAVDAARGQSAQGEAAGEGHRHLRPAAHACPRRPRTSCHDVLGKMAAGKGDSLPVSALPTGGTFPTGDREVGEAQYRPDDSGVGQGAVHPVRQVRAGVPARGDPRQGLRFGACWPRLRRPSRAPSRSGRAWSRSSTRCRWRRRTAPDARLCVEICPAKSKSEAKHKAINMEMQAPLRAPEALNWSFFESIPDGGPQPPLAHPGEGHSTAGTAV